MLKILAPPLSDLLFQSDIQKTSENNSLFIFAGYNHFLIIHVDHHPVRMQLHFSTLLKMKIVYDMRRNSRKAQKEDACE